MSSECCLHLYADNEKSAALVAEKVMYEVYRIEARYSRYHPDSVLSTINQHAFCGGNIEVDTETAALLDFAFAAFQISHNLFDITSGILRRAWNFNGSTLPSEQAVAQLLPYISMNKLRWSNPKLEFLNSGIELDFGGIGKEYAVDCAADICTTSGITQGLIDFGGDIRVLGAHPDGSPWYIAIRDPHNPEVALTQVELTQGALATSGNYERYMDIDGQRYSHILIPLTGWSAKGLCSVSVSADSCLLAGVLSTTAILKGKSAMDWLDGLAVSYLAVDDSGQQYQRLLT